MVPRLYLRRLLLPYCLLALSKRDSVSMNCDWFRLLLLRPDEFSRQWPLHRGNSEGPSPGQFVIEFAESQIAPESESEEMYNDVEPSEAEDIGEA